MGLAIAEAEVVCTIQIEQIEKSNSSSMDEKSNPSSMDL